MVEGCTFADVCAYLKKQQGGGFLGAADHLTGLAVVSAAGAAALAGSVSPINAVGLLGLLSAKDQIIASTGVLLERIRVRPAGMDELQRLERLEKAYCLVCHTAFFDAVGPEFAVGGYTSCGPSTNPLIERGHSRRVRRRGGHVVHVGVRIAAQAAETADFCRGHTVPP